MSKKADDSKAGEEELPALQVPSHSLPNEPVFNTSPAGGGKRASAGQNASASLSRAQQLKSRIKPYPLATQSSGYQAVLEGIERRKAREMRQTVRTVEAARRRQQHRHIALVSLVVVALALAVVLLTQRK